MAQIVAYFPGIPGERDLSNFDAFVLPYSKFHMKWDPMGNPIRKDTEWPGNYVRHAMNLALRPEYTYIFLYGTPAVLERLSQEGVPFITLVPSEKDKEWYLEDLAARGTNPRYLQVVTEHFEHWVYTTRKRYNAYTLRIGCGDSLVTYMVPF